MSKSISKFTVFFEDPFWVGLYERENDVKTPFFSVYLDWDFGSKPDSRLILKS